MNEHAGMKETHQPNQDFSHLSPLRLAGLFVGLVISIAIGGALVFWSQTDKIPLLSSRLESKVPLAMDETLDPKGVGGNAAIPAGRNFAPFLQTDEMPRSLSTQGVPGQNKAIELPAEESASVSGKYLDAMRFHKTLESEIAHSLRLIKDVKTARVLLALPEQTGSVQEIEKPSASVMVDIDREQTLSQDQIRTIIHLVAASVPKLEPERVTLADQRGRLLKNADNSTFSDVFARQFAYKKNLEEHLMERIVTILSPIVGAEGLRAAVFADLDFSGSGHSPENPGLNFSQPDMTPSTAKEAPSPDGQTDANPSKPVADYPQFANEANPAARSRPASRRSRYKNGKNVVIKQAAGPDNSFKPSLRRLSVAVVLDDNYTNRADKTEQIKPFSGEEMNRIDGLVKQAVGFESSRGDQITVTHAAFKKSAQEPSRPGLPFWQQSWFYLILKQLTAGLALLLLFFGIVRPLLRNWTGQNEDGRYKKKSDFDILQRRAAAKGKDINRECNGLPDDSDRLQQAEEDRTDDVSGMLLLDTPQNYPHRLEYIKQISDAGAHLVAEVIKSWVKKTDKENNRSDYAALMMLSLGADRAANIVKHLSPREVQKLGLTMAGVEDMSTSAIDKAAEELIAALKSRSALVVDKKIYIRKVLTTALDEDKANNIIDRIYPGALTKGMEQFKWMDSQSISEMIGSEHPQIIAIILSILDTEQAAEVMMSMPENQRSDVLMRIAALKGVQPAALRELDQIIEQQLPLNDIGNSAAIGGIDFAAHILNHIDSRTSDLILEQIADQSEELARNIQEKMFVFDDLIRLDAKGIQTLLREISTGQLLLALKDAGEGLKEKIFKNMSRRAAEMMREDLAMVTDAKPSEIEFARKDILNTVKKLADAGELRLSVDED